jgi:hypothetical protein
MAKSANNGGRAWRNLAVIWQRPSPAQVWLAIETYLSLAYMREPPSAVRARLDTLHAVPEEDFYECAVFEREPALHPVRYRLRLGNEFYPHMKLLIDRSPDGRNSLFRADTHDQHCRPEPRSRDYRAFCELMTRNQQLAQRIEAAWEATNLPTFKSFLREDLARRKAAGT